MEDEEERYEDVTLADPEVEMKERAPRNPTDEAQLRLVSVLRHTNASMAVVDCLYDVEDQVIFAAGFNESWMSYWEWLLSAHDRPPGELCVWRHYVAERTTAGDRFLPLIRQGMCTGITCLTWDKTRRWLVLGNTKGWLQVWIVSEDYKSLRQGTSMLAHKDAVTAIQYERRRDILISIGLDRRIRVFHIGDQAFLANVCGHPKAGLRSLHWDAGVAIVSSHASSGVMIAVLDSSHIPPIVTHSLRDIHRGSTHCITVDSQREHLYTGSFDCTIRSWGLNKDHSPPTMIQELEGHTGTVTALCMCPELNILISGDVEGNLALWHLDSKKYKLIPAHEYRVRKLVWIPENRFVLSTSEDGSIKVWSLVPAS